MNKADRKTLRAEVRKHCRAIIGRARKLETPGAVSFFADRIKQIRKLSAEIQSVRGVHTYCLRGAISNTLSIVKYAECGLYSKFEGNAAFYSTAGA